MGFISVLPRLGNLKKISALDFRVAMTEVNSLLQMYAKQEFWSFYHKHKGLWEIEEEGKKRVLPIDTWSKDGIHPNTTWGRAQYKDSLRAAISKGCRILWSPSLPY